MTDPHVDTLISPKISRVYPQNHCFLHIFLPGFVFLRPV